jgi:hypothetical protein
MIADSALPRIPGLIERTCIPITGAHTAAPAVHSPLALTDISLPLLIEELE